MLHDGESEFFEKDDVSRLAAPSGGKDSRTFMNTNKIGSADLRQTPGATVASARVADETARNEFEHLYHRDHREAPRDRRETQSGEGRDETAPPDREKNREKNDDESLSSLMRSLFAERLGAPPADAAREAHAASDLAAPRPAEMVERLVEQILVSHPDQAGESEVRLMVKDSVLPDTEIRLSRGTDGLLSVTLSTGRNDAFQTLVAAQAELKQALNARETQEIRLTVVDTRGTGAEEGRSDRRSRGHTAYYGSDDGDAR
jgi:type III secretion system needle length determinant